MKKLSTVTKTYKGITYVFTPEPSRGFRVLAKGFSTYWYQLTSSVFEAKRRRDNE